MDNDLVLFFDRHFSGSQFHSIQFHCSSISFAWQLDFLSCSLSNKQNTLGAIEIEFGVCLSVCACVREFVSLSVSQLVFKEILHRSKEETKTSI